jgi:hypothetical protein
MKKRVFRHLRRIRERQAEADPAAIHGQNAGRREPQTHPFRPRNRHFPTQKHRFTYQKPPHLLSKSAYFGTYAASGSARPRLIQPPSMAKTRAAESRCAQWRTRERGGTAGMENLIGNTAILMGKVEILSGKSMILIGKLRFLIGKLRFLIEKVDIFDRKGGVFDKKCGDFDRTGGDFDRKGGEFDRIDGKKSELV